MLNSESCKAGFDFSEFQMGIVRILVGILKFYFVSKSLLGTYISHVFPQTIEAIEASSSLMIVAMVFSNWISLYIAFSGYADIAIGSSKLFGIRIRENFNFPFLATNIQNYWQRWNISVMNFVSEYVYMNFVRNTGLRFTGIFLVFITMGMWHRVSPNYMIWAAAHGTAMSLFVFLRRQGFYQVLNDRFDANKYIRLPIIMCKWALTLSFVSIVSAVGTAPDLEYSIAIINAIFSL